MLFVTHFNGNKSITSGGGGAVSTNNVNLAKKIKLFSTNYKTTEIIFILI